MHISVVMPLKVHLQYHDFIKELFIVFLYLVRFSLRLFKRFNNLELTFLKSFEINDVVLIRQNVSFQLSQLCSSLSVDVLSDLVLFVLHES